MHRTPPFLLVCALIPALALGWAGCLPGSEQKTARDLFPSDSLSRRIAAGVPVDTLQRVRTITAPPEAGLEYPTGIALLPGDRIAVVDARRGALHRFSTAGDYLGGVAGAGFAYPFLAGARGDTVAVLSRGANRVDLVVGDRVVRRIEGPSGRNAAALLTDRGLYFKTSSEDDGAVLRRLDPQGEEAARYRLSGPWWRHLGFLRAWGDTLVSLSGYRPVVDVLPLAAPAGAALDTLALAGFDSPQLARSRLFATGEVDEPPLLSPAAAALGDRLFVLNARPGWTRIDVFRRDPSGGGRLLLERGLVAPAPAFRDDFFAADLAVREAPGGIEFAVLEAETVPAVALYRWAPSGTATDSTSGTGTGWPSPAAR
ncbi:MAG: hypothetical protein R3362_08425 [Rhodothermales bacterium]|nr:hypothetical protein [Rhodothermales bacterium]